MIYQLSIKKTVSPSAKSEKASNNKVCVIPVIDFSSGPVAHGQ